VEVSAVCQAGIQNVPAGVTPSGSTYLVQRGIGGACSTGLSLFISDEFPAGSGVYQSLAVPPLAGADTTHEEGVTLTSDGLTLIAMNAAGDGFVSSTRSAVGKSDFSAPVTGDFAQIQISGASGWAPVISADGLAFYYSIVGDTSDGSVSRNGIYESVRESTNVPFPPGTLMPPIVQSYAQYVNGVSTDRLAIFLTAHLAYESAMLTRKHLTDPFENPLAPNPPPKAGGVRARPLAGCTVMVGTYSSGGGCSGENVYTWPIQ
jgi:hypothetical protein